MAQAFVSVGSNIDPEENVAKALDLLQQQVIVRALSTVFLTEPVGARNQAPYYNCIVRIETEASPVELKHKVLRHIEAQLGRKRDKDRYAARTIDLDLILYDDVVLSSEEMTLPGPDIVFRPYLAEALRELAPELILPGSGLPIRDVAARLKQQGMTPLPQFTERLRKDLQHERE
jgi:2-amino-4-hydroxy-6-hydroxymethyldihydropteridine diphosphokinase